MIDFLKNNYHIMIAAICASLGWMIIIEPLLNRYMYGFNDWWKFWKMWDFNKNKG